MIDGNLAFLYDTDAELNAIMKNKDSIATHLSAIGLTKKDRQRGDNEVKRLHNATASLQISSTISKLTPFGDVDNALDFTQYVRRKLASKNDETENFKQDGFLSLIQQCLVCSSGRVEEATQFAKNLK